jgi:hypothetical protein
MTIGMTEQLVKRIAARAHGQGASALHFVCGALMLYDAARGASPYDGLDVERVFAAVELLAERHELEVSPFVSSWHPAVDAWDETSREVPAFWDQDFARALARGGSFSNAGKVVADLVNKVTGGRPTGEVYRGLASQMLNELKQMLSKTEKQTAYLQPLARIAERRGNLNVATLNYDLSVEQAADAAAAACTTGIEGWVETGRWSWPDGGLRLLKLHGSIDWAWESMREEGHLTREVVRVVADPVDDRGQPVVVFGQRGKLRARGPFLSLLAEFETALAEAEQLVVIGYSFRDDHVNELIRRWWTEDLGRTILAVDPFWPTDARYTSPHDFRGELEARLLPPEWKDPKPFAPRLRGLARTLLGSANEIGVLTPLPSSVRLRRSPIVGQTRRATSARVGSNRSPSRTGRGTCSSQCGRVSV